ncbi:MAG: TolC family protein [Aliidongia sp.]
METAAGRGQGRRGGCARRSDDQRQLPVLQKSGVFSAHTITLSQAFPLWGKRDLRREAALADVDTARGQEQAAADELDEKIKLAYAQYHLIAAISQ